MSEPLFKSLNKRSRSAFDDFADVDEVAQGFSIARKSRSDYDAPLSPQVLAEIRQRGIVRKASCETTSPCSSHLVAGLRGNDSWTSDASSKEFVSRAYFTVSNCFAEGLARSTSFPLCKLEKALKRRAAARSRHRTWSKESAGEFGFIGQRFSQNKDVNTSPSVTATVEPLGSSLSVLLEVVKEDAAEPPCQLQTCSKQSFENCSSDAVAEAFSENKLKNCIADVKCLEVSLKVVTTNRSCISDGRCPPFGMLSICGRRREMEDTYTVEPDFAFLPCDAMGGCCSEDSCSSTSGGLHFFGVYDGHGGPQASSFCKERLHIALTEEMTMAAESFQKARAGGTSEWRLRWEGVMAACFLKMDKEVGGICPTRGCYSSESKSKCCVNPIAPDNVGSTAVVAVIGSCQIIVGNCGDSRAVLCRGGKAVPLSRDHKPDREDELSRIEAAGGSVIHWDCYRVGGLLAMSRAIGDRFLKQFVTAEPEVTCAQRTPDDECLILASDGLWDVVSNELACDVACRCLKSQRRKCAKEGKLGMENSPTGVTAAVLTKLALSLGSKDNITVVVVDLKIRHKR